MYTEPISSHPRPPPPDLTLGSSLGMLTEQLISSSGIQPLGSHWVCRQNNPCAPPEENYRNGTRRSSEAQERLV